jgi:hypothetical protein
VSSAYQASGSREALAGLTSDAVALARQTDALEQISRGDSMQSVLTSLASAIEENRPGVHCTFLLLDEADGGRLFTIASPSPSATRSTAPRSGHTSAHAVGPRSLDTTW